MLARTTAVVAVLLLAACGGGHKDTASRLGGVVRFVAGEVSDGDVADPNAPYHPNDTFETAQAVAPGSRIGGWVGAGMDDVDWYRVTLAASQHVGFTVVEPAANGGITACLFAAADLTTPVDCASPSGTTDDLVAASAGDHYVRVEAVKGASTYLVRIGAAAATAIGPPALHLAAEFVPGEVLVRFREPAGRRAAAPGQVARAAAAELGLDLAGGDEGGPALLRARGAAQRAAALRHLGVAPLAIEPGGASLDPVVDAKRETLRMVAGLRARADVASADPNYVFHPTYVPADPDAFCTPEAVKCHHWQRWHYDLIHAQDAWDLEPTRGADVVVAVIDTGVFTTHPDLAGRLTTDGYDFVSDKTYSRDGDGIDDDPNDPGDDPRPGQSSFHGTHVTGTIVASADNGLGGAGIAFGAKVMPVRALGVGGGTSSDIIQAIRYVSGRTNASPRTLAQPVAIANLSFGCTNCYSATEEAEYQAAREAGVILVAASGNDGEAVDSYPAAYPSVLSVGAVTSPTTATPTAALASYSNTGPTVALVAPGGDETDRDGDGKPDMVFSTWVDDRTTPGTQKPVYAFMAGTSMAAPHVSGVVALMKAACPSMGPDQLRYLLTASRMTDLLGAAPRNDTFGYGVVDAAKGVHAAIAACNQPVPPSLSAAPARFAFAPSYSSKTVRIATSGGDAGVTVSVTGVVSGAEWLTVEPDGPDALDANGLGTYRLTVDRTHPALAADGIYGATVLFSASSDTVLAVPVSVTVGPTVNGPGGGYAYVLLFTCDALGRPLKTQGGDEGAATATGFRYDFPLLAAGRYCVVAGTDENDDGAICGEGEACSILGGQNATTLGAFSLSGSQLDHDLTLTYQATATAASAGTPLPASTFRRSAATPVAGAR